jgi:hypothetical protein
VTEMASKRLRRAANWSGNCLGSRAQILPINRSVLPIRLCASPAPYSW